MKALSDDEVAELLVKRVVDERSCLAEVLYVLGEFDKREIFESRAYPSTFAFCMDRFSFSEDEAYRRIHAARLAREYPSILGMVRRCEISLAALNLLGPHLTPENHERLLRRARNKTKRQLEMLVAEMQAKPVPRESITVIPASIAFLTACENPPAPTASSLPPPAKIEVLTPERIRVAFNVTPERWKKLERLKGLLRHKLPAGLIEDVVAQAVDDSLSRREPSAKRPTSSAGGRSRRISKIVKAQVWTRDGGMCSFVAEDGTQCCSRDFLQFDHIKPWALGGSSSDPRNVRLLCGPHNRRAAREAFGPRRSA